MSKLEHAGASRTVLPGAAAAKAWRTALAMSAAAMHRHVLPERRDDAVARLADDDDRRPACRQRARQIREVAALEAAAENDDESLAEALDGAPRRLDVGGLRVVHELHAGDVGHRLERVLEPGESLDRARSSPPA